jgi:hypothetical protein
MISHGKKVFSVRSKQDAMGFKITDETSNAFPEFNTSGRSLLIQLNSTDESHDPHLKECMKSSDYMLQNIPERFGGSDYSKHREHGRQAGRTEFLKKSE